VLEAYQADPPAPGATPTAAELLVLIRQVYAEDPPAAGQNAFCFDNPNAQECQPADGRDGQNAFCYDNPDDPACQPRQGAQGVSVVRFGFERTDDGQCVLAQVLNNPATGTEETLRLPIPDQMCQQADPPADDDPGLLPGG
jgi:hypothetical protein